MKSKSIGSLILLAIVAPSCGGGGGSKAPPKAPILAQWQTQQRSPTSSHLRSVIFANPTQGLVAGENGSFFRTDDGGVTWTQQEFLPPERGGDIVAMSAYGITLAAAGRDTATGNGRFWEGRNSTSWVTPDAVAAGAVYTDVNVSDPGFGNVPGTYWMLRRDATIDYSFNGAGGTFQAVVPGPFPPPPPNQLPPRPIAWTDANGIAFIGVSGQGLVCGQDAGYAGDAGLPAVLPSPPGFPGVPATPARGPRGQIIRSIDWGSNWNILKIMPDENNVKTLRRTAITRTTINVTRGYACGDDMADHGIVLGSSTNVDGQWDPIGGVGVPTTAPPFRALTFPVNDLMGWVVGNTGTIYRISATVVRNPGNPMGMPPVPPFDTYNYTWTQQTSGTTENLYSVSFVSNDIGYAVGDNGIVLKTTTGSTTGTWTKISKGDAGVDFNAASFSDDGVRGLAVGDAGKIYRTVDSGVNWTLMTSGTGQQLLGAAVPRIGAGTFGYVCGAGGTLLRNSDVWGVGAWTAVTGTTPTDTYRAILFPQSELNGVCVGSGGGAPVLLRTLDGTNWSAPGPGHTLPNASYNALSATAAGTKVYASGGANGLISVSSDAAGGWNSWTDLAPSLGGPVTIPALQSPEGGTNQAFAASSSGGMYHLTTLTPTWTLSAVMPWAAAKPVSLGFSNDLRGVTVTDAGGIFTTIDGAVTWSVSSPHTKDTPRAVWMSPTVDGLGYVVCSNGTILRTTTGGR